MREPSSLLVRGILGVLVGLAALLWPGITLAALVVVFAAYALIDGIANLITGFLRSRTHQRAWPFLVHGLVGVAAAALAFFYPRLTAFTLYLLPHGRSSPARCRLRVRFGSAMRSKVSGC